MYATLEQANEYFSNLLNTEIWDSSTDAQKEKALALADSIINRLNILDKTDSNFLEAAIPAACEIAKALLDGVDPDKEYENLMMVSQTYGGVTSTYARTNLPAYILAGVPCMAAWRYLQPYVANIQNITLVRR